MARKLSKVSSRNSFASFSVARSPNAALAFCVEFLSAAAYFFNGLLLQCRSTHGCRSRTPEMTTMSDRLNTIVQSLGFRLLVPLFLTVGVVLAIHAMISFDSTKEDFLSFVRADLDRTSRADHAGHPRRHALEPQGGSAGDHRAAGRRTGDCRHPRLRQEGHDHDVGPAGGDRASDRTRLGDLHQLSSAGSRRKAPRSSSRRAWNASATTWRFCAICR